MLRRGATAVVHASDAPPLSRGSVTSMQIRAATADDVPAIVALQAADQLGQHRESSGGPLDDAYVRAFAAIDADPNNQLVVGVEDGEVVATLQLTLIPYLTHRGSRRAQVEAVRVAADHRGRGLGDQLMRWAEDQARAAGCAMIQLTSNKARGDAHRFYERLGYASTHEGFKRDLRGDAG